MVKQLSDDHTKRATQDRNLERSCSFYQSVIRVIYNNMITHFLRICENERKNMSLKLKLFKLKNGKLSYQHEIKIIIVNDEGHSSISFQTIVTVGGFIFQKVKRYNTAEEIFATLFWYIEFKIVKKTANRSFCQAKEVIFLSI